MPENIRLLRNLAIGIAVASVVVSCYTYAGQPTRPAGTGTSEYEPLILDGVTVPVSEELRKFMEEAGYTTITLTNAKGQVKIVNSEGRQIEPCGIIDGTLIEGNCNLENISLKGDSSISILLSTSNPVCQTKRVGGRLVQLHADTRASEWRAGDFPCHPGPSSMHSH